MRISLVLLVLVAQVDHRTPDHPVAGILAETRLFGDFACDRFVPEPVAVFGSPSEAGSRIGVLETLTPWYRDPDGDCEWIEVGFRSDATGERRPVRLMEYSYEEPGLVVLEERDGWLRIELADGRGWIRSVGQGNFHSYDELLRESLAYLTAAFDGAMWPSPGGTSLRPLPEVWGPHLRTSPAVRVLDVVTVDGEPWLRIRLDPEYGCGDPEGPLSAVEGWVPGYTAEGTPVVWFHSRGC